MSLVEFKSRMYGASRFYLNPDHVISVYLASDGCHIVTTEIGHGGQNVHVLVDEPLNRVLAKLGAEGASAPPAPALAPPLHADRRMSPREPLGGPGFAATDYSGR